MIPDANFSLDKAKAHLRVTHALEDALITAFLDAAVAMCERFTRLAWTERAWSVAVPANACACSPEFHAALSPATVEAFAFDGAGGEVAIPAASIVTTTVYGHTVVSMEPTAFTVAKGDVGRLEFTASPPGEEVPPDVYAAAMLYLGDLYENREAQITGIQLVPNRSAEQLLAPYVVDMHA